MMKNVIGVGLALCICSQSSAAIFTVLPDPNLRTATEATTYATTQRGSGEGEIVTVDVSNIFSFDVAGSIPPNATLDVNLAGQLGQPGQPQRVIGLGWDVQLDAFSPSWMSDATISFGNDPTYLSPDLFLAPGMGFDFPGFQSFTSNGIVDLRSNSAGDQSFELSSGVLHLEFFEAFDDFGPGPIPDAQWRPGSQLFVQTIAVPEPSFMVFWMPLTFLVRRSYARQ